MVQFDQVPAGDFTRPKKIYLGWSVARGNAQPWKLFEIPHLMVNAYDFWNRRQQTQSVHRTLEFEGEIFCDSGGYQVLMQQRSLKAEDVLEVQLKLGADLNAVLDVGNEPGKHIRNLQIYQKKVPADQKARFVPVVPHDLPDHYLDRMVELCPTPKVVAIGKVVPSLYPLHYHDRILNVMRNIQRIKSKFPQSRIHIFGVGGVATAALFFVLADSTDSSAWLHDARFRKLRVFGGGVVRADRPSTHSRLGRLQENCLCPACKSEPSKMLSETGLNGLFLRAVHNAWVLKLELKALNKALSSEDPRHYLHYLEQRLSVSSWHRGLFQRVRPSLISQFG